MSDPYARLQVIERKKKEMMTLRVPVSILEDEADKVCVFCDTATSEWHCPQCMEYKGLMTIAEWEAYTGEKWED